MKEPLPQFWSFNRIRDASSIESEDLIWRGPFSWIGYEEINELPPLPSISGVYLFTFENDNGYLTRLVGVTNSMRRRFRQHTREFFKGSYTVLNVESAKKGIREEVWHGWGYARGHQGQFRDNEEEIMEAVKKELTAYRLFITEIPDRRIRERLEAAITINAYNSKEPWADLIDAGMALRKRTTYEMPINVKNICPYNIHGLPEVIEI